MRAAEREIRRVVEDGRRSDATRGYGASERDARRPAGPTVRTTGRFDDGYRDDRDDGDDGDLSYDEEEDDWILEGLEDELADAAAWAGGGAGASPGRYRPAAMSKYVDDDFEPMVYTREPDDADEYNFFAGSRFRQLGAAPGVEAALAEMGIERLSHIQALTYKALAADSDDETREGRPGDAAGVNSPEPSVASDAGAPPETPPATPSQNVLLDQAGSGKTLAYLLPLMQRLQTVERGAGAREAQPAAAADPVSHLGAGRAGARGGAPARARGPEVLLLAMTGGNQGKTQTQTLKEGVDVVVGTPGRVGHLLDVGKLEVDDLEAVVMDECDVLLGDSFEFAGRWCPPRRDARGEKNGQRNQVRAGHRDHPGGRPAAARGVFRGRPACGARPRPAQAGGGSAERLVDRSAGTQWTTRAGPGRKYRALEQLLEAEREKDKGRSGRKGEGGAARRMLLFLQ